MLTMPLERMSELMYVGLDVQSFCHGTMMNEEGRIVKQGKFSNDFLGYVLPTLELI